MMPCADDDRPSLDANSVPTIRARRSPWATGMVCVALLPLLGFIGVSSQTLWGEWGGLKEDQYRAVAAAPVGYVAINPKPSFADRPADWFHDEGDDTLIWAGWRNGKNQWFRVGRGELSRDHLSEPIGRDVVQAIDHPVFEKDGGRLWAKVPEFAPVVSIDNREPALAYPVKVLEKVEVLNEDINGKPILIVYTPFAEIITVYDPMLDGHRLTLGHTGYFLSKTPMLYDRGTESLWIPMDGVLSAVAGKRKGAKLSKLATLEPEPWGDWRARNPSGRLLVGADRSKQWPAE